MAPTKITPDCYYTGVHVGWHTCNYCGRILGSINSSRTDSGYNQTTARRPKKKDRPKKQKGIPNPYNRRPKNYDPHAA